MTDTMKALVYASPRELRLERIAIPALEDDEALIRVVSCGICGSDVAGYLGKTGRRIAPMVMGHEFSGVVAKLGGKVEGLTPGQRVTAQPIRFCGECEFCRLGKTSLCSNQTMIGVLDTNGAMAQYVKVSAKQVVKLPDDVDFDTAALAEPFAVAYSAVGKTDVRGKSVAVVGNGTIGLMIIAALRMCAARSIYAMDIEPDKRRAALSLGASEALDPTDRAALDSVIQKTGGGVDVAFEAVGCEESVATVMSSLKKAGTAVWVGNMAPVISLNMQQIVTRELQIKGSFDYSQKSFADTVSAMGGFDFSRMIDHAVSLDDAPEAFRKLGDREWHGIKTVIHIGGENNEQI